ncbi:MAG: hypothetical protein NTW03_12815 [Verrucomicrobia bacterium]|nr:hypothetical protein [Verrucomicrobiota bacterium]
MKDSKPVCFVIMPIGKDGSSDNQKYKTVYELIIKKSVEEAGFQCERADEIPEYGPIPDQVKKRLESAELVVADLSGRNPNVFYELGFRHALRRPTMSIADNLDGLPFDVATYRTVQYRLDDLRLADKCREAIRKHATEFRQNLQPRAEGQPEELPKTGCLNFESQLSIGLSNVYQLVGEVVGKLGPSSELYGQIAQVQRLLSTQSETLEAFGVSLTDLKQASNLLTRSTSLGLVSMYLNRLEAIDEFWNYMVEERQGISFVGSTIFGLKGTRACTFAKILNLLKEKVRLDGFQLRIMLTHWDFISLRMDQEKTEKNLRRYVISSELQQAVECLKKAGLSNSVRFYRGSPTCFTIVCEGQQMMLANPYPYEREAFNSWTVTFRETRDGVYWPFKAAHVDTPWDNPSLSVKMNDACEVQIRKRLEADIIRAEEDAKRDLGQIPSSG